MSRKQNIRWLSSELPELVAQGVLPADAAERVRAHYGAGGAGAGRSSVLIAFSILGAVLIGAGIITLLAYNWSELSRAMRTAISFLPLVAGQLAALWVVRGDHAGTGAREGIGTFLMLAVGASIALVSQTYHLPDQSGMFILAWMLLGLPVVYVLRASLPAIIYLAGIIAWSMDRMDHDRSGLWIWPLAALAVPHMALAVKDDRYGQRTSILLWCAVVTAAFAIGITVGPTHDETAVLVAYSCFLSVLYLSGSLWFGDAPALWQRPFYTVGTAGTVLLSFLLTVREFWGIEHWEGRAPFLVIGLLLAVVALLVECARRRCFSRLYFGVLPLLIVAGLFQPSGLMATLFNAYVLVLGVAALFIGVRERRLGKINGGMLILSVLIVMRFFDMDIGFIAKGIVFIVLGIAFLVANIFVSRWMRRVA